MTVRPEDQPLPLDEGQDERKGRPPGNTADDGKSGGASQGGRTGTGMGSADGGGRGSENERDAPGIATEKKADDTK